MDAVSGAAEHPSGETSLRDIDADADDAFWEKVDERVKVYLGYRRAARPGGSALRRCSTAVA